VSSGVEFAAGDLNLAVSTTRGASHDVMSEIKTKTRLRYLPVLAYDAGQLCQQNVSNVHDRTSSQCYDMCLVPETNHTFSVEFLAIPGDVEYLHALQAEIEADPVLKKGDVVHYCNRKRSDHLTMIIKSW